MKNYDRMMIHCSVYLVVRSFVFFLSSLLRLRLFFSHLRSQVRLLLIQIKCLYCLRERMSNSEFKARALYDFVAEGPNELTFKANEILTITSNAAGNGWW